MRIDGFTCCVGAMYTEQLRRSLDVWLRTLDSITIVTKPGDPALALAGPENLQFVETDVFTRHDAYFNKGAALCLAYAAADPTDWVLHFDSDIIPPDDWRTIAEARARRGSLSGAFRYDEHTGKCLDEAPLYPYGYFHLWHTSDERTWRWPLFDVWHAHAGSYDANFTDLWPTDRRDDLGFKLIHQGERRKNWFGPGADPQFMRALHRIGLRRARMRANAGQGRLAIPEPRAKFCLCGDAAWTQEALRACRRGGPFAVRAEFGADAPDGYQIITPRTSPSQLEWRILQCL